MDNKLTRTISSRDYETSEHRRNQDFKSKPQKSLKNNRLARFSSHRCDIFLIVCTVQEGFSINKYVYLRQKALNICLEIARMFIF